MNGNVTPEIYWLPTFSSHSETSDVYREAEAAIGPFAHPFEEGGSAVCSFFAPVREPSRDRLVTQRLWVSTREYGGWDCTGERGRDGDMPAMVKKKQRDASYLLKCRHSFNSCCFSEGGGSSFSYCSRSLYEGLTERFSSVLGWSKFVFF